MFASVLLLKWFPGLCREREKSDSPGSQMGKHSAGRAGVKPVLCQCCAHLWQKIKIKKVPVSTLKSCVILDFSNKTAELVKSKTRNILLLHCYLFVTGLSFFLEFSGSYTTLHGPLPIDAFFVGELSRSSFILLQGVPLRSVTRLLEPRQPCLFICS